MLRLTSDLIIFGASVARFVGRVKRMNWVALLPMFCRMKRRVIHKYGLSIFCCSNESRLEHITSYCLYHNILLELKYTIALDLID